MAQLCGEDVIGESEYMYIKQCSEMICQIGYRDSKWEMTLFLNESRI